MGAFHFTSINGIVHEKVCQTIQANLTSFASQGAMTFGTTQINGYIAAASIPPPLGLRLISSDKHVHPIDLQTGGVNRRCVAPRSLSAAAACARGATIRHQTLQSVKSPKITGRRAFGR